MRNYLKLITIFSIIQSTCAPLPVQAGSDPILLKSVLIGYDLQNAFTFSLYQEAFEESGRKLNELDIESIQKKFAAYRKELNTALQNKNNDLGRTTQWIALYFSNLRSLLGIQFHLKRKFNFHSVQQDWSLQPTSEVLQKLNLYSDTQESRYGEKYFQFTKTKDGKITLSASALRRIAIQYRLSHPSEKDFFEIASYLLYREKTQAYLELKNLFPKAGFKKPKMDGKFISRIQGFPDPSEIEDDLALTKKEIEFRNALSLKIEKFEKQLPSFFDGIQNSLMAAIRTQDLDPEDEKAILDWFKKIEKKNRLLQITSLLQKSGELFHTMNTQSLRNTLKPLLLQGIARSTRQYFEWLSAYIENQEKIASIQRKEIEPGHPSNAKANFLIDRLGKDQLFYGLVRLEVFGKIKFWDHLETVETIYNEAVEKAINKPLGDLIPQWILATKKIIQTEKPNIQTKRLQQLIDASETINEGLKNDRIQLDLFAEFVYQRLYETNKEISSLVENWYVQITSKRTYESSRNVFLEIVADQLDPTLVQGGYLRVRKLLATYHDITRAKNALGKIGGNSEIDRYLNAHSQNAISSDLWQLIQIGTWYGFHIPPKPALKTKDERQLLPKIKDLLLAPVDRIRYRNFYKKSLINAISNVMRILFVRVEYQGNSIPLREVIIDLKSKNQTDISKKALPYFQEAAKSIIQKIQKVFDTIAKANTTADLIVPISSSYFSIRFIGSFPEMKRLYRKTIIQESAKGHLSQIAEKLHGPIFWGVTIDIGMRMLNFVARRFTGRVIPLIEWIINGNFYLNHIHRPLLRLFWIDLGISGYDIFSTEAKKIEMAELFFYSRGLGTGDFKGRDFWKMQEAHGNRRFHFLAFQVGAIAVLIGVQKTFEFYHFIVKPRKIRQAFRFLNAEPGDFATAEQRILEIRASTTLSPAYSKRAENAYQYLNALEAKYATRIKELLQ